MLVTPKPSPTKIKEEDDGNSFDSFGGEDTVQTSPTTSKFIEFVKRSDEKLQKKQEAEESSKMIQTVRSCYDDKEPSEEGEKRKPKID